MVLLQFPCFQSVADPIPLRDHSARSMVQQHTEVLQLCRMQWD